MSLMEYEEFPDALIELHNMQPALQVAITTAHGYSAAGKRRGQWQSSTVSSAACSSPVSFIHSASSFQRQAHMAGTRPLHLHRSLHHTSPPPHSSTTRPVKRSITTSPTPSCHCTYRSRQACKLVWQVYPYFASSTCPMETAHRSRCISTSPPPSCRYARHATCPMAATHWSRCISTSPPPSCRCTCRGNSYGRHQQNKTGMPLCSHHLPTSHQPYRQSYLASFGIPHHWLNTERHYPLAYMSSTQGHG
ncbi:hypothetical protein Pcinc_008274 [Petrolisthes cinctipes]|uniref:Uncharacterized protein n=1 Tax=Petrolisthes cinctipes TaxID=88211 RepID=A0AAE1GDF8_PETCI|nr:hypothetical protein Pcinc_008274 [Petrolisthes cinctipes]